MSLRRLASAALISGAALGGAITFASGAAVQAQAAGASTAASSSVVVGDFRGSIRTGPLADLSLTGKLALKLDGADHTVSGILVDGDGAGGAEVLARVSGHFSSHSLTLLFHTTAGRTIRGTASSLPSADRVLRGTLHTAGGKGDWEEVPPGVIQNPDDCLIGVPCKLVPTGPTGPKGPGPSPSPPPGAGGDNGLSMFCNDLINSLGDYAQTKQGQALIEQEGCSS